MTISKELMDELLSGVERPEDLLGDKGLMKELKVRLMERMLGAELTRCRQAMRASPRVGLYAAGLSTRDIRSHLEEIYGLRVSADPLPGR